MWGWVYGLFKALFETALGSIVNAYEKWIEEVSNSLAVIVNAESDSRSDKLKLAGERNLSLCREQSARITVRCSHGRDMTSGFCCAETSMRFERTASRSTARMVTSNSMM